MELKELFELCAKLNRIEKTGLLFVLNLLNLSLNDTDNGDKGKGDKVEQ